jgi:hypothetical protein
LSFDNAAGPGDSYAIYAHGYAILRRLEVVSGDYTVGIASQGSTVNVIDSFVSSNSSNGAALKTTSGTIKVYNSRVAGHVDASSLYSINFGASQVDVTPDGAAVTCVASFHFNFNPTSASCG